jgi:hypothetical protein
MGRAARHPAIVASEPVRVALIARSGKFHPAAISFFRAPSVKHRAAAVLI